MKNRNTLLNDHRFYALLTLALTRPSITSAAPLNAETLFRSIELNLGYLYGAAGLLIAVVAALIIFARRSSTTGRTLQDVTTELDAARNRLAEEGRKNEETQHELQRARGRHDYMLLEANVGMFQMDLDGTCTYLNNALQEMSGLYPKKARKQGLQSAICAADLPRFETAWNAFTSGGTPFDLRFRFERGKGRFVYVHCRANKILNERKDTESYIGWVTDVSHYAHEVFLTRAETKRYQHFVTEALEGYFQMIPEKAIDLSAAEDKVAEKILSTLKLADCNEPFAALYGTKPTELNGRYVGELQDGCGIFKNSEAVKDFIESGFNLFNIEAVQQDPNGNRINLLTDLVGMVEDNKLVGIWGAQRNVSQQRRERTELTNQVQFLQRILNTLPADVYVKDTRCRYLYASRKMAEHTGIPQEEWIGKTIFEVIPATSRDHDKPAIEVMKSGRTGRKELPTKTGDASGWMETIQTPLVSEEGLVEGVVGLSVDTTDRRTREEKELKRAAQLEQQLSARSEQLQAKQQEHTAAAASLAEAQRRLSSIEAEHSQKTEQFKREVEERKTAEETLRKSEEQLRTRQAELEQQLEQQLQELTQQNGKLTKWEELISIKESSLRELEEHADQLQVQLSAECDLRLKAERQAEATRTEEQSLKSRLQEVQAAALTESARDKTRHEQELARLSSQHELEVRNLDEESRTKYRTEHEQRKGAERKLRKTEHQLQDAQDQLKRTVEQHAEELEQEVAERKASAEKLIQSMEELHELKQQFSIRIEEETRTIKQELARKQIREKALRQNEKELESRISELEKTLQQKIEEHQSNLQVREEAEVQRQQAVQQLEDLKKKQEQLVARETQKLNLNMAEIRLDEVKHRKVASDLQQHKEQLEEELKARTEELKRSAAEQEALSSELAASRSEVQQLKAQQEQQVQEQTAELKDQLSQLDETTRVLQQKETGLREKTAELQTTIGELEEKLATELQEREQAQQQLAAIRSDADLRDEENESNLKSLREQLERTQAEAVQKTRELTATIKERNDATAQIKETERFIEALKEDYRNDLLKKQEQVDQFSARQKKELKKSRGETRQMIQLVSDLKEAVTSSTQTVISSTADPQTDAAGLEKKCRKIIDVVEFTHEMARLHTIDREVQANTCNLPELVNELDREFTAEAETRKLFFAASFSQQNTANSLPELVETDETKLRRLLRILLTHSLHSTSKGRLGLHAARKNGDDGIPHLVFDLAYTPDANESELLDKAFHSAKQDQPESWVDTLGGLQAAHHYAKLLNGHLEHHTREGGVQVISILLPCKGIGEPNQSDENDERTAGAA